MEVVSTGLSQAESAAEEYPLNLIVDSACLLWSSGADVRCICE